MAARRTSCPYAAGMVRTALLAGGLASVGGCAIDGYTWERATEVQQVTIRLTEVADVAPLCARYLPGQRVMACAVMHVGYCEIIVPPNAPALVAHEAAHCLGFMHPGDHNATRGAFRRP